MREKKREIHIQASASSILVISWKCFVFGKPRALIPNACLDSWKCRSKFFLRRKGEGIREIVDTRGQ